MSFLKILNDDICNMLKVNNIRIMSLIIEEDHLAQWFPTCGSGPQTGSQHQCHGVANRF